MGKGSGRDRRGLAGACLLAACMAALAVVDPPFLNQWEERAQDVILGLVPPVRPESACVIVAADEKSRREVGPWPWPDETAGRLVELISRGKPRAVGIVSCPASSGGERELAESARRAGNVAVGYTLRFGFWSGPGGPAPPGISKIRYVTNPWGKAREYRMPKADGTGCVDVPLADAAATAGFTNSPRPEDWESQETPSILPRLPCGEDPVMREAPLVSVEGDAYFMSLPLALASMALHAERVTLRIKGDSVDGVELDGRLIPTDVRGMLRLRPSAGAERPGIIPASDVLLGNSEPGRWAGKIVLLGECEAPVPARVRGRLPASAPPVVLNADAVDALVRGLYIRRSRLTALLELALAALFPFIAWGAFRRRGRACPPSLSLRRGGRRAWLKWGSLAAVLCVCAGAEVLSLAVWGEEMRPFYPALSAMVSWAVYATWKARETSSRKP